MRAMSTQLPDARRDDEPDDDVVSGDVPVDVVVEYPTGYWDYVGEW